VVNGNCCTGRLHKQKTCSKKRQVNKQLLFLAICRPTWGTWLCVPGLLLVCLFQFSFLLLGVYDRSVLHVKEKNGRVVEECLLLYLRIDVAQAPSCCPSLQSL
jgi:hypothetical protein